MRHIHDISTGYGKVFIYNGLYNQTPALIGTFEVNDPTLSSSQTSLGKSLIYDPDFNIIISGAPDANLVQVNFVTG